jgi:hypothetical protein
MSREDRFGVKGNEHEGIFFTEDRIDGATSVGSVHVEISRQNSNLTQVKSKMATAAKAKGATAIQSFTYGQKAHKWWQQAFTFKWDSESWHGDGEAVVPPHESGSAGPSPPPPA